MLLYNSLNTKAQTFGRYGDCSGRGLCSIAEENINKFTATQKMSISSNNDTTITLKIYLKNITPADEVKILGKPFLKFNIKDSLLFLMDNDLILTSTQKSLLELPTVTTKICKGIYPMQLLTNEIIIQLKVK